MSSGGRAALLVAPLLLGFGCRSESARRLEAETLALRRPIDALRNAPNDAKPALLEALTRAPCEAPPACELKQTCVDAYARHLSAVGASHSARALLAQPDGGTRASIAAAELLTKAELALAEAKQLTERCASLQGALLRRARER